MLECERNGRLCLGACPPSQEPCYKGCSESEVSCAEGCPGAFWASSTELIGTGAIIVKPIDGRMVTIKGVRFPP